MSLFLLLFSLARADALPEPCDGLKEGDACTTYDDEAGTCTSCGTDCLSCEASTAGDSETKSEDKGCSTGGMAPLGLLLALAGVLAMRSRRES